MTLTTFELLTGAGIVHIPLLMLIVIMDLIKVIRNAVILLTTVDGVVVTVFKCTELHINNHPFLLNEPN